ncbi:phage tail assembly chaperone [Salmonella enterica]
MEFNIKGNDYRLAKLDLFTQFKVTRKLLPLLVRVMTDFASVREGFAGARSDEMNVNQLAPMLEKVLPPLADELSALSDEDTNAIIFPCLAVVARKNINAWVPVANEGVIAFDDIDLLTMLTLVARVVADSLGNILPAAATSQTAGQPQT